MINKEKFMIEIDKLNRGDKDDLIMLLSLVTGEKINVDPGFLADKIVKDLFGTSFTDEALVPWNFFETEIGKSLLLAKYELGIDVYFVTDLVDLTGYSKQYISKEKKLGNIKGITKGGTVYFTEDEVNRYLEKKGFKTIADMKRVKYEEVKENLVGGGFERESSYID